MGMADKEKLVELLQDVEAKGFFRYGTDCRAGEVGGHEMTAEDIADYLMENGVKIPVLCKDCRHRIFDEVTKEWFCNSWHSGFVYVKPNDFCSYGERKDPDD